MRLGLVLVLLCCLAGLARADEWVAAKPGVMCASADALGRLTLPNGDSRTHRAVPTAADLATASAGGCVDIAVGQHVTTVETYRNTSVALVGGARLTIPNVDFDPATASASNAPVLTGYRVASHLAIDSGNAIEVLVDSRISPQLAEQMWNTSDDPGFVLPEGDPRAAAFTKSPPRPAQVRLVDASGGVLAQQLEDEPLARVTVAKWHGLTAPTYLLTVDHSIGMGSYAGPSTTLLTPSVTALSPVTYAGAHGRSGILTLASTLKTGWQVVHGRAGGPDEIEQALCRPGTKDDFTITYQTYRLVDGSWQMAERQVPGFWENESFPPRSSFP